MACRLGYTERPRALYALAVSGWPDDLLHSAQSAAACARDLDGALSQTGTVSVRGAAVIDHLHRPSSVDPVEEERSGERHRDPFVPDRRWATPGMPDLDIARFA